MSKRILAILLILAMIFSITGCGNTKGENKDKKVIKFYSTVDIASLDPQLSNSAIEAEVNYHIYDTLYRSDNGKMVPAVAKSYDVSDDGLTYTFHLRDDVKWSDGQTVTAKDFEYGIKRLMDPATAAPGSFIGVCLKNADAVTNKEVSVDELGVKAIDDTTLEIQLEFPAEYFIQIVGMCSFAPARQDLVEKYGKDFCSTPDKQVYCGPFVVSEFGNGTVKLVKNDGYYDKNSVYLDEIVITTVSDGNTALAMYESGQLDIVEVPTALCSQYADKTKAYYNGANDYVALNEANKFLQNKNFRLALNYIINRDEYIQLATDGVYDANTRYVLPQVNGVEKTYGEEYPLSAFPLKGDEAKAKEYLEKALSELGLTSASDIHLTLLATDSETSKKQAEVIQAQFQKLGIVIDIEQVQYSTQIKRVTVERDYDIAIAGWMPDYSDPYSYLELWYSSSSYNYLNYNSSEYDKYIDISRSTTGKERMDALFNAEKVLLEDGALVPLQLRQIHYMMNEKITGVQTNFVTYTYSFIHADIKE